MGVLPCQFLEATSAHSLELDGTERFDLELDGALRPRAPAILHVERRNGQRQAVPLLVRIDTPIEAAYYAAGGIMPYVFEHLASTSAGRRTQEAPIA